MERGLLMPSQSPPLLLTLTLMLMLGTVTTDTVATTGLMATTVAGTGRRRGPLMPSLLLMLSQSPLLPLSPTLMLMPGTVTTATVATDTAATTGLMATMATMERGLLMPSLQLMP